MTLNVDEAKAQKLFEVIEHIGLKTTHQVNIVLGQFERSLLKIHVSWRCSKHKTKINVDNMAKRINEQIPIVPIPYLENITDEAIPCQAVCKIFTGYIPLISKILTIDTFERPRVFLQWTDGHGIWQVFDESLLATKHDDLICSDPQGNIHLDKHIVD